ncbi:MAG TPA: FAD-dependent oxidoreductase, partial [Patescibacteria group bacterium]|nr:FAD-dependent oxidoreductase [Patescibacteria group bacterium]
MTVTHVEPDLGFSLTLPELYHRDGLIHIDHAFLGHLAEIDTPLRDRLLAARIAAPDAKTEQALLIALAPHVEDFFGRLFGIAHALNLLTARSDALAPLFACKRLFIQRRALKAMTPTQAESLDGGQLTAEMAALLGAGWDEVRFAEHVLTWLDDEPAHAAALDLATRYAAWAVLSPAGRSRHAGGHLFKAPAKFDPFRRVPYEMLELHGVPQFHAAAEHTRPRDGFGLTDCGTDLAGALDEASYCILCHHQGKDSCSKGVIDKASGGFAKTPLGVVQTGCPLEERISEMHEVKLKGLAIAALAMAVVDNPMIAGTGHRICNDCMTACIYTAGNRDPVNIPEVETRVLKDVLGLPWGFEVYSLLTRWNPLNLRRPLPKAASGRSVLVVGLGPAGYTLAHHLMNDGHAVVAIDGLKIEPLAEWLSGVTTLGERVSFRAIRDIAELHEDLGERVMAGFGGVAEYGITVRWDKNFLKLIRLLLERRSEFLMAGGVRLGGTLTLDGAFAMGFDHVALCMGAGRPTVIDMPHNLARGVRQASDFLMALQLTGAARQDSVANLQVRLPVVVIGGGLTAIDACTEALAYYPVQVEKFLRRFETLVAERGEAAVRAVFTTDEAGIADEFLSHARAIRAERAVAATEGRSPHLAALLRSWGGATIAYRRRLIDSPAYRNHEEVAKALEEGILFAEQLTPLAVEIDDSGAACGLRVRSSSGIETTLPARAIIVAAGTVPNTVLARETAGITLHGKYFQAVDEDGVPQEPERQTKPRHARMLMSIDGHTAVSFFGDLHPSYAGNVVSAMASAKQGYPVVSRLLERAPPPLATPTALFARINAEFRPTVHSVERLSPTIVEVIVSAPAAARAFQPGQFYR